ncbi:dihydrodipicolinate synthase family protein [Allosediminivita pacifica]|uniref:4-hydroxy-tetrahydrodipicolinate synthase n=1 Tax=Allosediminivita pacifica TaxID=1267769 RepID=A0A2T6ANQ0_9RHOB|nr:dihydrodipicolinate synthase family protein [Allosediminivita pacifica]PTX45376.1 4-hydroxy-tetrahydrodipicolinate synthase [Allosediminivita pacifica]GGB20788.1 dihydrodipicolinate synthase family protein [Allosediminivita pacifica]
MPLLTSDAKGVFVISVTPFTDKGEIDFDSLDRVVDFYFDKGADGLTILGMMGEAPKLTQAESRAVAERVIKRAGDKPVVVGVSAPGLAAIGELGKAVMDMGAAGCMVTTPGSLKTDPQIHGYFAQVARTLGVGVPIVLQDFPLSTGVNISDEVLGRIIDDIPEVVMLKHEDWPGLSKITKLRRAEAEGRRRISVLCGNGGVFLPEEVARGADGAMTGFGYPEMLADVVRLAASGDQDRAQDIFDAYLPLVRYEQQPGAGLAVRKHVLAQRGAIASPALRAPGAPLTPEAVAEVDRLVARQEKRLKELN